MPRAIAVLVCCALQGCGASLDAPAQRQAIADLHCVPPGLRVRSVGELESRGPRPLRVRVFDAEGCYAERRYFCATGADGAARCATQLDAIATEPARAGLERALSLLRVAARGRCPGDTLRVAQESETLFTFEACDGRWEYHCRAKGCERLR